jgi:lipopolysaccharide export system permease protein
VETVREGLGLTPGPASEAGLSDVAGEPPYAFGEGVTRSPSQRDVLLAEDPVTQQAVVAASTSHSRLISYRQAVNRFQVELHKKYTLAFACIVFVLLGMPLAIRFPRGGLGLVIAASSGIFAVYWVGLIAGEDLADRGIAPPVVTMWIANVIFTALGLWMAARMGREAATMRGGGWDDLWWSLRALVMRPFRRSETAPREAREAREAA